MFDQKYIDRFWDKIRKRRNGCWEWVGGKNSNGYGEFWYKERHCPAHVFAFMLENNIILEGREIIIRHICNNPLCCNPKHLIDGTQKENIQDASRDGLFKDKKICTGKNNSQAKLTEEDIKKIRQLGWHFTASQIARMSDWKNKISRTHINNILLYKTWKHLKED